MNRLLNAVFEFISLFFSTSTIHGLRHITAPYRHPFERIIWLIMLSIAIYGCSILSGQTLKRYTENPTVISMERDKNAWNTTFPSATICPTYKIDQNKFDDYIDHSNVTNKTLLRLFITSLIQTNYENFNEIVEYDEIHPDEYLNIILQLRFPFDPALANSETGQSQLFSLEKIVTEMGICYVYHSKMAIYSTPEYWTQNLWNLVKRNNTFYINPLDGEIFVNFINMSTGYDIYFHGPYEMADISTKKVNSNNGQFVQIYLSALTLFSSSSIKKTKISQRKCRFYDESNLERSPVYSFVLCRINCRATLTKKLCGCLPHFYRKLNGENVCNVEGLHCLTKHKEQLIYIKGQCQCLPNCDEVYYTLDLIDSREWWVGSNLQWGLRGYPNMRLRRDVIFGFSDVLVFIGGVTGLFLGCSVLSFIEILYFFTLRLFIFLFTHKKTKERKREVLMQKF